MAPMREARGSKRRRRDVRHSGGGFVRNWLPPLLVVALLASGLAAYRFEWGQRYLPWLAADPATEPEQVLLPAGLDLPEWSAPVAPAAIEDATAAVVPDRVAAALRADLADPDLGRHVVGAVSSLAPGSEAWTSGDGRFLPASTTKLLTVGAALETLGPDHTFTTRVVRGDAPREVVLVGGGDPLLASRPLTVAEAATAYPARADVATLALEVADALGGAGRVRVRYDDSLFTGPTDNPAWRRDYVPDDIVSPITALMVDGGVAPDGLSRSDDPSLAAADAFAEALRAAGLRVAGEPRRDVVRPGRRSSPPSRARRWPRSPSGSSTSATTRAPRSWRTTSASRRPAPAPSRQVPPACWRRWTGSASTCPATRCTTAPASRAATGSPPRRCSASSRRPPVPAARHAAHPRHGPAGRRLHRVADLPLRRGSRPRPRPGAGQDRHPDRGPRARRDRGRP